MESSFEATVLTLFFFLHKIQIISLTPQVKIFCHLQLWKLNKKKSKAAEGHMMHVGNMPKHYSFGVFIHLFTLKVFTEYLLCWEMAGHRD